MANAVSSRIILYVGTYTRPAPYLGTTNGMGIYIMSLDPETGSLTALGDMQNIDNPSYLTISPDMRFLYATSEVWLWPEGTLTAYSIDAGNGELRYINKQPTLGSINAYVTLDRKAEYALVANYWDGASVALFPIRKDGGIGPASDSVTHKGSGTDPVRQGKSHAHCVLVESTNRWIYVADLGLDKIISYTIDRKRGRLIPHGSTDLEAETGPRHMVFRPDGKYLYAIGELGSVIVALAVDSETGALTPIQSVSTLPEGIDHSTSHCSDIQVHPSGRFLYAGNRGHDSLAVFGIDPETGRLSPNGYRSTLGKTPRNFAIDPTGAFMLVANQDSDTIVTFRINQKDGSLEETGQIAAVPTPVCLKMITL